MTDHSDSDDEELELFRDEMASVRALSQNKVVPWRKSRSARPFKREEDEQNVLHDMLSDPLEPANIENGEELLFSRTGLRPTTLRKLRRGQFSIEAELDLHRMTADEARQSLAVFIRECTHGNKRCVRIIHGKGHGSFNKLPVLKHKLNHWLRQKDEVLAFCSARPNDGGTGAVYVLLKRPR
ncbi:MAG: Smr/MutS family protein [Gammaproteobacteria bacterium]|nr:Smr/MutS family protein [Gammaproteobacteria bacterium]MDH5652862.1 Smr/MutS family protein [Gammaproteobacteria bacterium]